MVYSDEKRGEALTEAVLGQAPEHRENAQPRH
jgi:hypothetical protein